MVSTFKAYVCVDAGASKTQIRVLDSNSRLVGTVFAGPASLNYNSSDVWASLTAACAPMLAELGIRNDWCDVLVAAGIAGTEVSASTQAFRAAAPRGAKVEVVSDGYASLLGAIGLHGAGAVISAGTGTVGVARKSDGSLRRVGGWGYPVADEGGGAWIGAKAIREMLRSVDEVGSPEGDLYRGIRDKLSMEASEPGAELAAWASKASVAELASLAPLVCQTAESDPLAEKILLEAGAAVSDLARSLLAGVDGPLCIVGGLSKEITRRLDKHLTMRLVEPLGTALDGIQLHALEGNYTDKVFSIKKVAKAIDGLIVTPAGMIGGVVEFDGAIISIRKTHDFNHSRLILPGFVDTQINGGGGADALLDGEQGLEVIASTHLKCGVTTSLATFITAPVETTKRALAALKRHMASGATPFLGAHLEGPFISPRRLGAHPAEMISPNVAVFDDLTKAGPVSVITLAPELPGALELIRAAASHGARVQIGHTNATVDQCREAIASGASGYTHLFNAMSPLQHRAPGVVGAALLGEAYASVIVDMLHVEEVPLRVALRCVPKLFCVSDATAAFGMADGEHKIGGQRIIKRGNELRAPDGALAGANISMLDAFRNLQKLGLSPVEAAMRTSTIPAEFLGLTDRGAIQIGRRGDMVVLGSGAQPEDVFLNGTSVLS
ncbi:MAG: N-acetylglucosamine-6-phosphate deacetylase [Sulfuritalea sp.]|nr:N-acetylglucosamine-6-phosphate deacetylase [Sulfuritalea sp.]